MPTSAQPRWYLRPCALGFAGLALSVILWGLGYKLSLYHLHPDPASRTPVAKLWISPRPAGCVPAARAEAHRIPVAHALVTHSAFPARLAFSGLLPDLAAPLLFSSGTSLPSRSPPPQSLRCI